MVATEVVWKCGKCGRAIRDGEGYLDLSTDAMRAHKDGVQAWAEAHPQSDGELGIVSVEELMRYPHCAPWLAWHGNCDPAPRSSSWYFIEVERIRTTADLLWWTAHLLEKGWIQSTNWGDIIRQHVNAEGQA